MQALTTLRYVTMEIATITTADVKVTVLYSPETKRENTITNLMSYNLYWKTVHGHADDASLVKEPESSLPFSQKLSIGPSSIQQPPLNTHTCRHASASKHTAAFLHVANIPFRFISDRPDTNPKLIRSETCSANLINTKFNLRVGPKVGNLVRKLYAKLS